MICVQGKIQFIFLEFPFKSQHYISRRNKQIKENLGGGSVVCIHAAHSLCQAASSSIYHSNSLDERGVSSIVIYLCWLLWSELLPNITQWHPTSFSKHTELKLQKMKLNKDIGLTSPFPVCLILTHTISFASQAINATKWTIFREPLSHLIILLT